MDEKGKYKYLEDRLRNNADEQQFPYDPEDWKALEKMLDEDKKPAFGFFRWGAFLILFVLSLGLGYWVVNSNTSVIPKESNSSLSSNAETINAEATAFENRQESNHALKHEDPQIEDAERMGKVDQDASLKSDSRSGNIKDLSNDQVSGSFSSEGVLGLNTSAEARSEKNKEFYFTKPSQVSEKLDKLTLSRTSASSSTFLANNDKRNSSNLTLRNSELANSILSLLELGDIDPLKLSPNWNFSNPQLDDIESLESTDFNKFAVTINAGLEASKTPLGSRSKLNFNGGLQFNHAISNKFLLLGGVRYGIDHYRAEKGEYKSTSKFFERSGDPEYTLARCTMLDFHTGVAYNFNAVDGPGLSAQLSLVSNAMLNEEYDYMYSDSEKNWTGSWFGAHSTLFSALDLSVNYRLATSPNRFVEISPYLKIPTRGIGHGNIKLNTFGLKLGMTFSR